MQIEKRLENSKYRTTNKLGVSDMDAMLFMANTLRAEFQRCIDAGSVPEEWAVRIADLEPGRRLLLTPGAPQLYETE